jgi:hypothetical protein
VNNDLADSGYGRARYRSSISAKPIGLISAALISYVLFAHIHSAIVVSAFKIAMACRT